ncbi:MAG: hypothetical protein H0V52_08005, partial [Acidimicrobiia bacterium]|nr:hypothetical protein [Acidimicrobiia bacterium]
RAAFAQAVRWGWLERNPVERGGEQQRPAPATLDVLHCTLNVEHLQHRLDAA